MDQFFNFFANLHAHVFDPDRLPVAVAALVVVLFVGILLGPLGGNANPLFWRAADLLFGPLGGRLDKTDRPAQDLVTRGTIITIMAAIMAFLAGSFFQTLSHSFPTFRIVDIVALSIIMGAGAGFRALFRLYMAMEGKGVAKGAFYALAVSSRLNLALADEYTLTRAGIGFASRLLDKGVVGPVLWYLIAGLPAAFVYAALAALSWRFGKDGFTKGFGKTALALEKLMGFVPTVFSGVLVACAGLLTPTAGMTRAFIGLLKGGKGHAAYEEGGAPVTAMAYALNINLGGAVQDQDGSAMPRAWAGPDGATARLEAAHLRRALYILAMSHLLFLAALMVAMLIEGRGMLFG